MNQFSTSLAPDEIVEEEVTDAEWFFLVSMTQSFVKGVGLPGQALYAGAGHLAAAFSSRDAPDTAAAPSWLAQQSAAATPAANHGQSDPSVLWIADPSLRWFPPYGADAVSYVNELRSKLQALEANKEDLQAQIQGLRKERESAPAQRPESDLKMTNGGGRCHGVEIEVKLLGSEAMIRLQSQKRNHPAAVLMAARSGSALRERVGGEGPHDPAGDGEDVEPGVHAGAAQLCCLR
ncbi:hypothetical protein GW17_00062116 [Ensete ventricosum]|nr:hypothetical protein GW17_00062116 [Ensete ventricosum]